MVGFAAETDDVVGATLGRHVLLAGAVTRLTPHTGLIGGVIGLFICIG